MREILVHLNINPADDDVTPDEMGRQIMGALEVGMDPEQTPDLYAAGIIAPLCEEV